MKVVAVCLHLIQSINLHHPVVAGLDATPEVLLDGGRDVVLLSTRASGYGGNCGIEVAVILHALFHAFFWGEAQLETEMRGERSLGEAEFPCEMGCIEGERRDGDTLVVGVVVLEVGV